MLWNSAYESGDPQIGDSIDVELACDWPGEQGVLTEALKTCGIKGQSGFIDEDENGIYTIHDLFDHAPEYVQKRAKREIARRKKGKTISDLRREAAEKRWEKDDANGMQTADTCIQTAANGCKRHAKVRTPTPAPTPAPTHKRSAKADRDFELFWKHYPRKVKKQDAKKVFKKLAKNGLPSIDELIQIVEIQKTWPEWRDPQFIPHPTSWLNAGRWEDVEKTDLFTKPKPPPMTKEQIEEERRLMEMEYK